MENRVVRPGRISTRLCLGFLFLGVAVLVRYAMRDMRLDVDLLRESLTRMPGLIVENVQLERVVSGDLWRVRVPYLERDGEETSVRSLDIRRQLQEGGEWYFFGAKGVYNEKERAAQVRGLVGTLETADRVWNLESPELQWDEAEKDFLFPRGLTLYDDEFLLNTSEASMDAGGNILLEKGGLLQWTKPLER
ncbi:MAG: hypothetical protein IJU98_08830 [Synergistaceae bacterium]|nr:hypothetical protein [Synergistaceae bacterium]